MAALGIDPTTVLRADPIERALLQAALPHAHAYAQQRDQQLAERIIAELGRALKRGK